MRKTYKIFMRKDFPVRVYDLIPKLLEDKGIEFEYTNTCGEKGDTIVIKASAQKCDKVFREAYNEVYGEEGFPIRVRRVEEHMVWVSKDKALDLRSAAKAAIKEVKRNNYNPGTFTYEFSTNLKDTMNNGIERFQEEWELEYVSDTPVYEAEKK